ncbi:MAG: hypothetical protein ACI85F_002237 [Bacteroidia bacterium]|jgi:hypothetical protein
MRKSLSALTFILFLNAAAWAQQGTRCQHSEAVAKLISQDPHQAITIQEAHEQVNQKVSNRSSTAGTVYQIPVVVHVVYNTAEQNISEASIYSQLDVLNADYRKQNADFSNVPSHFSGMATDLEIEFCLAHVDPNGNWSDGITRTETTTTQWSGSSTGMMSNTSGGHDPWPHSEYLNIWVVSLNPQFLGYAYPPGANPNGMVIGYKNFGTVGSYLSNIYDGGRTATHEIGHWLDLHHPWGPGGDNTNCTASDLVDDTPMQAEPNYNCPVGIQISCNNGPNGDMHMNFMDYANDDCMHMFTEGQKTRMRAALEGPRASILVSQGCNLTSVYESELSKNFSIYPNPASHSINLDLAPWINGDFNIHISNAQGRRVQSESGLTKSTVNNGVDISHLASGLYFIELENGQEKAVKRFSKL